MKVLSIVLLVFAVYFNVLLFYGLFSDNNDTVKIDAVITSVNEINLFEKIITYSYSYNGKTYTGTENINYDIKVGDLYSIRINKNNGNVSNSISNSFSNLFESYLVTILVFLSILFYGLSYYTNRN